MGGGGGGGGDEREGRQGPKLTAATSEDGGWSDELDCKMKGQAKGGREGEEKKTANRQYRTESLDPILAHYRKVWSE